MIEATVSEFGGIDIVINNAAAFVFGAIEDTGPEEWTKVLGVNVQGYANTIKSALPFLKKSHNAAIVNVASVAGKDGNANASAYSVGKAGAIGLTKSLGLTQSKRR